MGWRWALTGPGSGDDHVTPWSRKISNAMTPAAQVVTVYATALSRGGGE
jgi:hypothetical protein